MPELTPEQRTAYISALKDFHNMKDVETAHSDADQLLCNLLDYLGYSDIVEAYNNVPKWYA